MRSERQRGGAAVGRYGSVPIHKSERKAQGIKQPDRALAGERPQPMACQMPQSKAGQRPVKAPVKPVLPRDLIQGVLHQVVAPHPHNAHVCGAKSK